MDVGVGVTGIGDGIALPDHPGPDVLAGAFDLAATDRPSIPIQAKRITSQRLPTYEISQSLGCPLATAVNLFGNRAGLSGFGSIETPIATCSCQV